MTNAAPRNGEIVWAVPPPKRIGRGILVFHEDDRLLRVGEEVLNAATGELTDLTLEDLEPAPFYRISDRFFDLGTAISVDGSVIAEGTDEGAVRLYRAPR